MRMRTIVLERAFRNWRLYRQRRMLFATSGEMATDLHPWVALPFSLSPTLSLSLSSCVVCMSYFREDQETQTMVAH